MTSNDGGLQHLYTWCKMQLSSSSRSEYFPPPCEVTRSADPPVQDIEMPIRPIAQRLGDAECATVEQNKVQ
ncbi:hypothetical protein IG631_15407 [Alternaria alternata]|nr:hypothetical protein IG631_15407 [Alternaria alternata]